MKAIRVYETGGPEVLRYEELAEPVAQAGQAVVRLDAIGLNFFDVQIRSGVFTVPLPLTLGVEAAGNVVAIAPGVTDVKVGDSVAYAGILGAYAQYAAVPADRLVVLPSGLDTRQGAAAMAQGLAAHYLTAATYPVGPKDCCLVHAAAGGVGRLICQVAKLRGARVIGTVSTEEKERIARAAGADEVIRYDQKDFVAETRRLTDGQGVNVVYDSVGKDTFDRSIDCLAVRGMMVHFGESSGPVRSFDPRVLEDKGSLYFARPSRRHHIATRAALLERANEMLGWVRDGKLALRIGAEFPLHEAAEAQRRLVARQTTGKVLLIP